MKGSYSFLAVDERFAPWLFLIRSSPEDLLQKVPETNQRNMPYDLHVPLMPYFQGYQGVAPQRARYLFLGKDANFCPDYAPGHGIWNHREACLEGNPDWLHDGGEHPGLRHEIPNLRVHHPALLQAWPDGEPGAKYHRRTFALLFLAVAAPGSPGIHDR